MSFSTLRESGPSPLCSFGMIYVSMVTTSPLRESLFRMMGSGVQCILGISLEMISAGVTGRCVY